MRHSPFDISPRIFEDARERIAGHVRRTPLLPAPLIQSNVPSNLVLKLENIQAGGSFKIRGVFNTLLQLSDAERAKGVVTASGGNHGVALALGAHRLGLPATVYLPAGASEDRVARVAEWGARVVKHGDAWDDANAEALVCAEREGLTYVHPFDAERTVAGQGTLGLELLDDVPDLDCLMVAIGGGGLISGVAAAVKQRRPEVRIIGVEPTGAASMTVSLQADRLVELPELRTTAGTLAPRMVSERTLRLTKKYVDQVVLVEDSDMIRAMRWLWTECNQLVEPAGAAGLAAILSGKFNAAEFRRPVALVCGGNADVAPLFARYEEAVRNR